MVLQDWMNVGAGGSAVIDLVSIPTLSIGEHHLVLEVSDGECTVADEMILTVNNSAPSAAATGGGTYEIYGLVALGGQVSDFDGDALTYAWKEGEATLYTGTIATNPLGAPIDLPALLISNLAVGTHIITLQVSDNVNPPVSSSITVNVIDTTAPVLAPTPDKTILWPPNHQMVAVTIFANASDNSGLPVHLTATIASNEPQDGLEMGIQRRIGRTCYRKWNNHVRTSCRKIRKREWEGL